MAIQYVIRSFEFAYNDEYYQTDGNLSYVKASYDTLEEAEAALKKLNAEALRGGIDSDLGNYEPFYEASEELIAELNEFCLARCGEPLTTSGYVESIPEGLGDDDVCEIAKRTGLEAYRLVTMDTAQTYYAIWMDGANPLTREFHYLCDYNGTVFYSENLEQMLSDSEVASIFTSLFPKSFIGRLEELSDSPQLLQHLIDQNPYGFKYQSSLLTINNSYAGVEELRALNALLKNPVFEVRELTFEQASKL